MLGAVMAGGTSRRLGQDKALVLFAGLPLWQRQLAVLRAGGASETVLVRRCDQFIPAGVPFCHDTVVDAGPLAGLQAAFAVGSHPWVAVLAVDMPGLTADWFLQLRTFCRVGCGAMVRQAETWEPLAAIYPREAGAEITRRLDRRELSLQRLADALEAGGIMRRVSFSDDDIAAAKGINTPQELASWQEKFSAVQDSGPASFGEARSGVTLREPAEPSPTRAN